MIKTKYASYCIKSLPSGCRYCVKGRKLVLFISGLCSRACFYCSLSAKRKGVDKVWANERECKNVRDVFEEVMESKAKGAGITGGNPLCVLFRTLGYVKALKKKFGKKFHIHIYLPTNLVTKAKLRKLARYIDETRFHPLFLQKDMEKEIEKIKLASLFWKRENIGIELPVLPDKFRETFDFIKKASPFIGFVNLNELEISDTNFRYITKMYRINKDTYTVAGSIKTGLKILRACLQEKLGLRVHLCTAKTKNLFQYKNRLKLHKIFPFGYRTSDGTVNYFTIYFKDAMKSEMNKIRKRLKQQIYIDNRNKRIILSEKIANMLVNKFKIARVEELPTWDSTLVSLEYV